ncbi:hypothetical protein [Streptomyces sp. NPDC056544]|uniref:hypothetical protein n=1 Tax=Streptomyces sp. NPDC056544 TaxID=3345863 RepID=UPI003682FE48
MLAGGGGFGRGRVAEGPASADFRYRWGAPGGIIGAEELAGPGERFVCVRPTEALAQTADLVPVTSFGGPSGGAGDLQIVQAAGEVHALIAVLLEPRAFTCAFPRRTDRVHLA